MLGHGVSVLAADQGGVECGADVLVNLIGLPFSSPAPGVRAGWPMARP